jgi:CHAT domain-containing protein/tetratricopeptide (TPR) repeat protein
MTGLKRRRPAAQMRNFHPRRPRAFSSTLVSALLSLALSGMTARASGVRMQEAQTLEVGKTFARTIKAGEPHAYQLTLTAGQLLRVGFEPQGFDMTLTLFAPDGRKLVEIARRAEGGIRQSLVFISETGGAHRLEARAGTVAGGDYKITLEELRPATAADRPRIAAEQAYHRGLSLQFETGTKDALREAARHYRDALAGWRAAADSAGEARALGSLGAVSTSLGDYAQAAAYYTDELKLFRAAGDLNLQATLSETLGWLYFNWLKDKSHAIKYLSDSHRLYGELADRGGAARALLLLGQVYTAMGESPDEILKSLDCFTEALAVYSAQNDPYGQGEAFGGLMLAWKKLRRPRAAIFFGKKAVNLYQELRMGMADLEQDTRRTFVKSKEQVYRTLAGILITENRLLEAEEVLDMLKEEEFFQFIRDERGDNKKSDPKSRVVLEDNDAELEKEFRKIEDIVMKRGRVVAELAGKTARTPDEEKEIYLWKANLKVANRVFDNLLLRLSREYGGTEQAGKIVEVGAGRGLKKDLNDLGERSVALYTLVTEDKYCLFLITPHARKAYERSITSEALGLKVIEFRQALQNPKSNPLPLARELYDIVIGAAGKDLEAAGARTLMWSLDGPLRYIPIAALHDGKQYLVERYSNSVFTSASKSRLKELPSGIWKGVGFGVSKAHGEFPPLAAVPGELRGIIGEEDGGSIMRGKIFLDEMFTEKSLEDELVQRYPLVHIASHFKFRSGDETGSYLLLGDGGRLSLLDLSDTFTFDGVELLTLSACDTAVGGAGADGREVDGLGMLSERLGAAAVMATLWRVADDSTPLLMQNFYRARNAQPGVIKSEAMRRAQVALLRGEVAPNAPAASGGLMNALKGTQPKPRPDYSHPYFWAPFILIGNWK